MSNTIRSIVPFKRDALQALARYDTLIKSSPVPVPDDAMSAIRGAIESREHEEYGGWRHYNVPKPGEPVFADELLVHSLEGESHYLPDRTTAASSLPISDYFLLPIRAQRSDRAPSRPPSDHYICTVAQEACAILGRYEDITGKYGYPNQQVNEAFAANARKRPPAPEYMQQAARQFLSALEESQLLEKCKAYTDAQPDRPDWLKTK